MNDIDLSVLVPTANRPEMLRTALASIARQTRLDAVKEIIVIENGGNDASRKLLEEFPKLPIRYIYRETPIPPSKRSMHAAWAEIRTEYFACLCDDDWWDELHLQLCIAQALENPEVASIYASAISVTSETSALLPEIMGTSTVELMAHAPQRAGIWKLSSTDLLMISLINTSFHYSTLLGKSSEWRAAIDAMPENSFDTDRILSVLANKHNGAIFINRPGSYIRVNSASESGKLKKRNKNTLFNTSTDFLLSVACSQNISIKDEMYERCRGRPDFESRIYQRSDAAQKTRLLELGIITNKSLFYKLVLRDRVKSLFS